MVLVSDDSVTVRDLGSANGTYVNNKRVSEQELEAGDHRVIGPVVLTVRVNGQPKDVKPVHTRLETRSPAAPKRPTGARPAAPGTVPIGDDEAPISALEALAGTDDTAEMDLDGSSIFGENES